MALEGNLRQFALVDLLRAIESAQRTGRLTLAFGGRRAHVYFGAGQWLLAERAGDDTPLAALLAQAGLIAPAHFETAVGVPLADASSISDRQAVRLLISARVLNQDQLRLWAMNDAIALLAIVLQWPDGEYAFADDVPVPPNRLALPLPVTPLVARVYRNATSGSGARPRERLDPETVIDFSDVDPASGRLVQLTREQWRVLTMVDGQAPLWAIAQNLQVPVPLVMRLAGELASAQIVHATAPVAAEPQVDYAL